MGCGVVCLLPRSGRAEALSPRATACARLALGGKNAIFSRIVIRKNGVFLFAQVYRAPSQAAKVLLPFHCYHLSEVGFKRFSLFKSHVRASESMLEY